MDYEKQNFSKSQKSHVFKWDNPMLLVKNANYLDYLDLVKIRLAIMLSDFAEKKETFLTINNTSFSSKQSRFFSKGLAHAFGQKMPNSSLFIFGQNMTRNNA